MKLPFIIAGLLATPALACDPVPITQPWKGSYPRTVAVLREMTVREFVTASRYPPLEREEGRKAIGEFLRVNCIPVGTDAHAVPLEEAVRRIYDATIPSGIYHNTIRYGGR